MTILKKNPNEYLYPTGKKNIITVIKNEASPDVVLWRVPYEDFNEGSKVIVAENEEALFYKNGIVEAVFSAGEFSLSTSNYAFLSRIRNVVSGGISAYNCRVIYINKIHKLDNLWGTDGPIQVRDKVYDMQVNLAARGAYTIQIDDSKKFYMKYAGSTASVLYPKDVADSMRAPVNQGIKAAISRYVDSLDVEILGINSNLEAIANEVRPDVEAVFEEYGVRLVNFYIEAIEIIEDEVYDILKRSRAEAAARVVQARSIKKEIGVLGGDYGRAKTVDIMMAAASNSSGGIMGEGMGLGAGMAMGGIMAGAAARVLSPLDSSAGPVHPEGPSEDDRFKTPKGGMVVAPCGHKVMPGSKFCSECGMKLELECPWCGSSIVPGSKFCSNCGKGIQ